MRVAGEIEHADAVDPVPVVRAGPIRETFGREARRRQGEFARDRLVVPLRVLFTVGHDEARPGVARHIGIDRDARVLKRAVNHVEGVIDLLKVRPIEIVALVEEIQVVTKIELIGHLAINVHCRAR